MATAPVNQTKGAPADSEKKLQVVPSKIIPIKVGWMGEQGAGKTSSAALFSLALSKEFHSGAPIAVTDPELGWNILRPRLFNREKVQLLHYTTPTFKAMLGDIRTAEKEGACVWNVELGKIWIEILRALQKAKPTTWGSELSYMWTDFVNQFLSSKLHCNVLGRIQDIMEEVMTEFGDIKQIKSGEGMKAGGQKNNFGYEPHLVIRMNLEQKPRVKKGKTFEDEGRMIHRAKVTKDRTWALNGKTFRWPDREGYNAGEYKYVWGDLRPHFAAMQETGEQAVLDTTASSEEMLDHEGNSEWYAKQQRRKIAAETWDAIKKAIWPSNTTEARQQRQFVCERISGMRSQTAFEKQDPGDLEFQVLHFRKFEERAETEGIPTDQGDLGALVDLAREEANDEWKALHGQPQTATSEQADGQQEMPF